MSQGQFKEVRYLSYMILAGCSVWLMSIVFVWKRFF